MLIPEMSRKGAPSTCVCSVGHRNEKIIKSVVESTKNPISVCLACSCSTKTHRQQHTKPEIAARDLEK